MVELFVRLGCAAVFLILGWLRLAPMDVAWKVALALAGMSLFGWQLERNGLKKSGVAGFFAIAEGFALALFLASSGTIQQLGFLVLIPCIYAGARFGSPMISMAPLAASSVVAAGTLFAKNGIPAPEVLVHAAGVLSVSLLLGQRRPVEVSETVEESEEPVEEPQRSPQLVEDLLELRENFRKLRDAYSDLERKSWRDKIAARIARAQEFEGSRFYKELCQALKDLSRAEEIAIYTLAQFEQLMVVKSVSQDFPTEMKDSAIQVDVNRAPIVVREQAEDALLALSAGTPVANVLLIHKGAVLGMICAIEPNSAKLDDIRRVLTEASPIAAAAVDSEVQREARDRRVKELELVYEVSSISTGASTPATLAARITRELKQSLEVDGVVMALIEAGKEIPLSSEGSSKSLLDCMSFDTGKGISGWIAEGGSEVVLFDARQDSRCDAEATLKRRIGCYALVPLWAGAEVVGYISASTQAAGGIDVDQIATLRLVAAETSRALERLVGADSGGMMTPREFSKTTQAADGVLVYLEPLKRDQIVAAYGVAAYEAAIRKFAHQVRVKLPAGGCLCRRDQGDFLVFLDTDEEFARNWANEVAASASFIAISTSDPAKRIPLALRAKVARLTSQTDQLSPEFAA
jgi:hypothetical protein